MDLKTYLKSRRLTIKEFAKLIKVSGPAVSNYICKKRKPRIHIAKKIIEVTNGKVTLEDLLE
jgi:predicted transcriptional regulator